MVRLVLSGVLLVCCSNAFAQQIIFSTKNGPIGRIAQRITGDFYTHTAIVLPDAQGRQWVYEQDWPRAKKVPLSKYGKRRTINDVYSLPLSGSQVAAMRSHAESRLGEPYRLRAYFRPGARSNGTWCSNYVGQVLNAGGYNISRQGMHEPENLRQQISPQFQYRYYR